MKRYFLFIRFKGTDYNGWQTQPNGKTVQEEIEKSLATLFQVSVPIMGAGRTDSGVHACCMVAHFDLELEFNQENLLFHINNMLPESIAIYKIKEVQPNFHARFAAKSRTYHYFLSSEKDPFNVDLTAKTSKLLDLKAMNKAAKLLLGVHDFSCFSKSKTQTFTNNCEITKAVWTVNKKGIRFEVTANRFLRNMVRAIVGTLIEVGEGKREVSSIPELLESKNRSKAGTSVPAKGLFLVHIEYPEQGFI